MSVTGNRPERPLNTLEDWSESQGRIAKIYTNDSDCCSNDF